MWKRRPNIGQRYTVCSGAAETRLATMVITQEGKTKRIRVEVPHSDSEFIMYKPISFSLNLNYVLFGRTHIVSEPEAEYIVFNLKQNSGELVPLKSIPPNCFFPGYLGFITATEVAFGCDSSNK